MNAQEARELTNEKDKLTCLIRTHFDNEIRDAANNGLSEVVCCWHEKHPKEKLIRWLSEDGFKVSCKDTCDQQQGYSFDYTISW